MQKKINILLLIAISICALTNCGRDAGEGTLNTEAPPKEERPLNVLVVTSDDLGKQLSCYGDDIIETPNLDNLASRGVMFHNAYVTQASCSSSRSSILTGMYPHSNGQIGLAEFGFKLNQEYSNIARALKDKGYQTGIIGKLHVEPKSIFPFDYAHENVMDARDVELVADLAETFIKPLNKQPFFLYLNYADPHAPLHREFGGHPIEKVNTQDVHAFDFQGVDDFASLNRIADYYNCVRRLDEGIGLLLEKLEDLQVLDNTLVFFMGDHGPPFVRAKCASYESSVNIPFIISCPQITQGRRESNALVSTVDIFPTIMEALGVSIPQSVQGYSLLPILEEKQDAVRNYLFTEFNYHASVKNHFYPRRTIRDKRYKLIFTPIAI